MAARKSTAAAEKLAAAPGPRSQVFSERVDEYPDDMLKCRDAGHHWKTYNVEHAKDGSIYRILACATCDARRNQRLDRNGYIVGSSYTYRVGYLLPGIGRLTAAQRATLRLASIDRSS